MNKEEIKKILKEQAELINAPDEPVDNWPDYEINELNEIIGRLKSDNKSLQNSMFEAMTQHAEYERRLAETCDEALLKMLTTMEANQGDYCHICEKVDGNAHRHYVTCKLWKLLKERVGE